jgi:hypothetical protein
MRIGPAVSAEMSTGNSDHPLGSLAGLLSLSRQGHHLTAERGPGWDVLAANEDGTSFIVSCPIGEGEIVVVHWHGWISKVVLTAYPANFLDGVTGSVLAWAGL